MSCFCVSCNRSTAVECAGCYARMRAELETARVALAQARAELKATEPLTEYPWISFCTVHRRESEGYCRECNGDRHVIQVVHTKALDQADKAADARWCAALELADWDGGVFHYEGRVYPWPTGFVPDCQATWESKTGPLEAAIAQARAEVERLTRENARIEAESRSDKALINRITRICDECPEESACEACEGSGVVPIDERAWTFGAAEKDRADKAEADRDEARARADAAESETVRRIVVMIRHCSRGALERSELEFEAYGLALADAIESGSWKEPGT